MKKTGMIGLAMLVGLAWNAVAEVQVKELEYQDGEVELQGYLTWDAAVSGPRPGVLVAHAWMGLGEHEMRRARELAALGYAALAIDMYGKGVRPQNWEEAAKLSSSYKADRDRMRQRAQAGLDALAREELCAGQPIAAIGYCFGGTVALELARSGAPLAGAVSFHGNLDTPRPEDARQIKGRVFVLHGADDPYVPPAQVEAFKAEMRAAFVDWQFVEYGGAVHSFTDPAAGNDPSKGAAYNVLADRRSWRELKNFLIELFQP